MVSGAAATFAVIRSRGPAWNAGLPMREQPVWNAHAAFMNALAADGHIVLGGPLGDGERTLLIIEAASQAAVRRLLESDPWSGMNLLKIDCITPWHILLARSDGRQQRPA
jgi:uncharacterized protein YciI